MSARGPAAVLAWVAAALAAPACGSFEDVTTVIDLRVLAVNTEPSEIIVDDGNPASNLPITVTPLLVDPLAGRPGRGPITWTLLACPNNPYGAAPPAGMAGAGMLGGGARTTVGSNECRADSPLTWPLVTAAVAADMAEIVQITAEQLTSAAMADFYVDQFHNLHGGLDLGLPINLQLTASDGVQTVVAIKRVLYWLTGPDLYWKGPLGPDQRANQTPLIPEVRAYPDRDPDTLDAVEPITTLVDGTPAPLPLGQRLWIEPGAQNAQPSVTATAEPYVTAVIDAATHTAVPLHVDRERLRYAFYATAGTFDPPRTASELPVGFVGTPHIESRYTPPARLDGLALDAGGRAPVTIWIVVRDERGGESWVTRQLALEAAP